LFGLHQAQACADAHITLISPFVGRILDWYKKAENIDHYPIEKDPGVISVKKSIIIISNTISRLR
jgi:transaldolase